MCWDSSCTLSSLYSEIICSPWFSVLTSVHLYFFCCYAPLQCCLWSLWLDGINFRCFPYPNSWWISFWVGNALLGFLSISLLCLRLFSHPACHLCFLCDMHCDAFLLFPNSRISSRDRLALLMQIVSPLLSLFASRTHYMDDRSLYAFLCSPSCCPIPWKWNLRIVREDGFWTWLALPRLFSMFLLFSQYHPVCPDFLLFHPCS